jgi:hypothetical protein
MWTALRVAVCLATGCVVLWSPVRVEACEPDEPYFKLGYAGEDGSASVPAGSVGFLFDSMGTLGRAPRKADFQIMQKLGKGYAAVAFSVEASGGDVLLRLERPTREGERYRLVFDKWLSVEVTVREARLRAGEPQLDAAVDARSWASVGVLLPPVYQPYYELLRYEFSFAGEPISHWGGSGTALLCKGLPDDARGWYELSAAAWPAGSPGARLEVSRDVWIDCEAARREKHPSIVKAVGEYYEVAAR